MTSWGLPVRDRIMLHLFETSGSTAAYEAPMDVTQAGIAEAVGMNVRHASQYLKPLVADGLVAVESRRILRQPRRRKVYTLTAEGRSWVAAQRRALMSRTALLRRLDGHMERLPLSRVYHEVRRGSTLLSLLKELESYDYLVEAASKGQTEIVDFSHEAPSVPHFFGRERELQEVQRALGDASLVVIVGMAGVGKTALASELCEGLRGERSLLWRGIRPWDTTTDLVSALAVFLQASGREELHAYLEASEPTSLARVEELLMADLRPSGSVLVFDDIHEASRNAVTFFQLLHRVLKEEDGTSAVLLSRVVPTFYTRRDVTVEKSVGELLLKGLDHPSALALLDALEVPTTLAARWVEASGGNPLFLRMLASGSTSEWATAGKGDVEIYMAEEISPKLAEPEKRCLELAALYEIPVPVEALLLEGGADRETLVGLWRRGLLDRTADGFLAHDLIRDFFRDGQSRETRESSVNRVVPWLINRAQERASEGRSGEAITLTQNALRVEFDDSRRSSHFALLAELRGAVGDIPGAVAAFSDAIHNEDEPEKKAAMHGRKGSALFHLGRPEAAKAEFERGLALLPERGSVEEMHLRLAPAWVAVFSGDFEAADREVEAVSRLAQVFPHDSEIGPQISLLRGNIELHDPNRRDPEAARDHFTEALTLLQTMGDSPALGPTYYGLGHSAFHLGETDEALDFATRALESMESRMHRAMHARRLVEKGYYLMELLGDFGTAGELFEEAYTLVQKGKNPYRLPWFHRLFADLHRRAGRLEQARESLEWFLASAKDLGPLWTSAVEVESRALMVRLCVACGDVDAAKEELQKAAAQAKMTPRGGADYHVAWARATLSMAVEPVERAEADFGRALDVPVPWHRHGIVYESLSSVVAEGEILLDYGRFLSRTGRTEEARASLGIALEAFKAQGREPLQREAQLALRSLELPSVTTGT